MKKQHILGVLVIVLMLAGCDSGGVPTIATETPAALSSPEIATARQQPVISEVDSTVLTKTSTPLPTTEIATATPKASPPAQPTPTVPPADHVSVDQAPYAESPCSDKYPCNDDREGWEARLRVPDGFEATYFARLDGFPTSLTFAPDGVLYVAVQQGYIATIDPNGEIDTYVEGLTSPTGIAFLPDTGDLYISDRLLELGVGGESRVSVVRDGQIATLFDGIPCCYTMMHAANGIAFGPDGYGYVGVGARADHGEILSGPRFGEQDELHPWEATVLRFSPDGTEVEPYAYGLRNPYDIAWDSSGNLYATDNAPDYGPPDELHLVRPGEQHGYPWYECDNCFSAPEGLEIVPPLLELVPHAAAAGLTVYQNERLPGYHDDLFIVLWSAFEGAQKVVRFSPDTGEASDFATGFAAPIDITTDAEGAFYVADWATGIIFRIAPVE